MSPNRASSMQWENSDVSFNVPFGISISTQFGSIPCSRTRRNISSGDMDETLRISARSQRCYDKYVNFIVSSSTTSE